MAMAFLAQTLITALFGILSVSGSNEVNFITITNDCRYPVWAAILSDAGSKLMPTSPTTSGGFPLQPAASNTIPMPGAGSGRLVDDGLDYFKVSLVDDGFNLSVSIQPRGAGNCRATSFGGSDLFSQFSKSKCSDAYDYASFTCLSADYNITFCPTSPER